MYLPSLLQGMSYQIQVSRNPRGMSMGCVQWSPGHRHCYGEGLDQTQQVSCQTQAVALDLVHDTGGEYAGCFEQCG